MEHGVFENHKYTRQFKQRTTLWSLLTHPQSSTDQLNTFLIRSCRRSGHGTLVDNRKTDLFDVELVHSTPEKSPMECECARY